MVSSSYCSLEEIRQWKKISLAYALTTLFSPGAAGVDFLGLRRPCVRPRPPSPAPLHRLRSSSARGPLSAPPQASAVRSRAASISGPGPSPPVGGAPAFPFSAKTAHHRYEYEPGHRLLCPLGGRSSTRWYPPLRVIGPDPLCLLGAEVAAFISAHSRIQCRAPFALRASKPGVRDGERSSDAGHRSGWCSGSNYRRQRRALYPSWSKPVVLTTIFSERKSMVC